jgi:hypothetical protein
MESEIGTPKKAKTHPIKEAHMLFKTLKWPVISLLITGGTHFILEAIWPDLKNIFVPAVLAPMLLTYGVWVGYKTIQNGGNYLFAIVGAVILGILPVVLETFGFGMILGFGAAARFLVGVYALGMILFGSLIGSGFALSKQ